MEYTNSFVETADKLAEMDLPLTDQLKVLSSLPDNYENFVVAMVSRDKLPLFETVKLKLLEEGARQEHRDESGSILTDSRQEH